MFKFIVYVVTSVGLVQRKHTITSCTGLNSCSLVLPMDLAVFVYQHSKLLLYQTLRGQVKYSFTTFVFSDFLTNAFRQWIITKTIPVVKVFGLSWVHIRLSNCCITRTLVIWTFCCSTKF